MGRATAITDTPSFCQASQGAEANRAAIRVVSIFAISNPVVILSLIKQFCCHIVQGAKVSRAIVTMIAIFANKNGLIL